MAFIDGVFAITVTLLVLEIRLRTVRAGRLRQEIDVGDGRGVLEEVPDAAGGAMSSGESQRAQLSPHAHRGAASTRQTAERFGLSQPAVVPLLERDGIRRDANTSTGGRALFVIPDGIDGESRRVIAYVNGEIERFRTGRPRSPSTSSARDPGAAQSLPEGVKGSVGGDSGGKGSPCTGRA